MTSKQTKRIAFLLAASLLMNTVALPVSAESDVVIVGEAPTEAPPTEAPVEIVTEAPTEAPTEAATAAPTEEATEAPTEETTEAPTEETTEAPTEETTEAPTEEPTEEPLTRESILAAQQEGYQQALSHFRSMDISDDRSMSLEWWCVMTGNVSMREPDYSVLDVQEDADASQEESAEKTWADYIVFSEVISVRSASDLILLSYVSPSLYQYRTVTLFADAGNEFDLVHPLAVTEARSLSYRGLGDLGTPFSGIIRYAENSENITFVLDAPLFIGLSTKARFLNGLDQPNTVFLVSKAGYAFDGLLARHITGEQQDEANWFIQLNAPEFTGGAVYVLPSLLGVLYGNANVNLILTDNSYLSPSPRGYLCATMYAKSSLSAWNVTRNVSVPLVGEVSPDATLVTDAPQEEITEPTEEVTEPTEEVTEPTKDVTEPTEEVTEPTKDVTEPTEEVTEPTEETTVPTEEVTEPTEEVTEPTTAPIDENTLLTKQEEGYRQAVEYYQSMSISSERTMPLEWWYVITGKAAMRQPDNSILNATNDAAEEPEVTAPEAAVSEVTVPEVTEPEVTEPEVTLPEATEPEVTELPDEPVETENDWSAFLVYPETIEVSSAGDLILLSYVASSTYQEREISLTAESLDLSQSLPWDEQLLTYQGLGSQDAPYSGVLRFSDGTSLVLSNSLFNALSSDAKFLNLSGEAAAITLVSKTFTYFDGLLAAHVLGSTGSTADWVVQLADPAYRADGDYVLPSVFGVIHASASVNLKLLDNTTLPPSVNGYLCTAMEAGSSLNATHITRLIATPMVGTLAEGAQLTTDRSLRTSDGVPIFRTDMSEEEFQELVDHYRNLTVEPGKMPLEWWFAACGKVDDLRAYLTLKAEREAAAHPVILPLFPDTPVVIGEPDAATEAVVPAPIEAEIPAPASASAQNEVVVFGAENAPVSPVFFAEEAPETAEPVEDDAAEEDDTAPADNTERASTQAAVNLNISSANDLINLSNVAPNEYSTETITITASGGVINVSGTAFAGLGSDAFPFAGSIQYSGASENATIILNRALFNALSADAGIANVNLTWTGTVAESDGAAILANTVYAGNGSGIWKVTLGEFSGEATDYRLPALIHTIKTGAEVTLSAVNGSTFSFSGQGFFCDELYGTLTVTYPDKLPTFDTKKDKVGGLVGTMAAGTALTVDGKAISIDVVTSGSTAGGLVGSMDTGAALNVTADSLTVKRVTAAYADGSSVGSLVGEAKNPTFTFTTVTSVASGTTTDTSGYHLNGYHVGGLVGKLTYSGTTGLTVLPVSGLKLQGFNCGGLFGELDNGNTFSLDYTAETSLADVTVNRHQSRGSRAGRAGGLIGLYKPTAGGSTLSVSNVKTSVTSGNRDFDDLGGLIGEAIGSGDNTFIALTNCTVVTLSAGAANSSLGGMISRLTTAAVHLKVSGAVTFGTEQSNGCTGGLVGYVDDKGHLIEVDDFTLNAANLRGNNSGGLVGMMEYGAVYMNKVPALNITSFDYGRTHGWIMGIRYYVLVCSAPQWDVRAYGNDHNKNNDTGVWGQVLQLSKFDAGLVTLDSANHTVTIKEPNGSSGSYTASSLTEFAALALRVQLNEVGMLKIPKDSEVDNAKTITLTLGGSIDLTGTGLTGLTPDCSPSMFQKKNYSLHGFVINGAGNVITLPNVPVFASGFGHNYQGLIARCDTTLELHDLTVKGGSDITGDNADIRCGIAGDVQCNATVNKVTSEVSWTIIDGAKTSNVSGIIGAVTSNNRTISFENSTWNGTLTDKTGASTTCIMGGFLGDSDNKATVVSVTDCTVSGTVQNTSRKNVNTEAKVGGLFGRLYKCRSLTATDLNVTNATVKTLSQKATGGLLGYELYCTGSAIFNGVAINGSALTTDARFGGLIYKGAGYWKVTGNGISFNSAAITGITDNTAPSGLLVSIGCSGVEYYGGLYLEVDYSAYRIDRANVNVTLTRGDYFDELVGRSIEAAGSGRNGIVSIATENHTPIDTNGCNTYQKQLAKDYDNPCTRYYYNLDQFRTEKLGNTISTAEKMVLWSAYNECKNCTTDGKSDSANSNLKGYFADDSSRTITGDIDLTGYSFYPVVYDGTSIQNAEITFGFQQLEETEKAAANKQPADSKRQHAGMHTGIFTTAINGNDNGNLGLSVNGLKLHGTVGALDNGPNYGVIIRDATEGKNVKALTVLNISNVTLDCIRVYPEPAAKEGALKPLLINEIGNYTTLNLTNVTVPGTAYTEKDRIATSLIGNVGSRQADIASNNIRLTFKGIRLAEDGKSGTQCNLFTHALFLESFVYNSDTCKGVYNFTRDEAYTVGREVSVSVKNAGKQYWFFNEWYNATGYVCGDEAKKDTAYTGYFPYVCKGEDKTKSLHEIDVNLPVVDLTNGCGTYSDPYRINGEMLFAVAEAIRDYGSREGWKVKVNTNVLQNGSFTNFANEDHHTYQNDTVADTEQVLISTAANGWTADEDADAAKVAENSAMLDYLRNAYYMVVSDVEITDKWGGLGEGDSNRSFKGVIIGDTSTRKVTIRLTSTTSQFGGLVKFSQGCVVKDLTIDYTGSTITLSAESVPNSVAISFFFGGVVGYSFGGDTVIDNVTVFSFPTLRLSTNNQYAAIGGYVGLVGGGSNQGGGGVVFRGSVGSTWQPNTNLYTNPYVGRVLDGYAVTEGESFINGSGNYTVPSLSSPSLTVDGTNVTVGNAEGLWLLSALENSRHGSAYSSGKGRSCTYAGIGSAADDAKLADEAGSKPYLNTKYGVASLATPFSITITADCDMRSYKNGFRGIGVSQGTIRAYGNELLPLSRIDGSGCTVTLAQNRQEVSGENAVWASMGTGLFPILRCTTDLTVQNLTLAGSTGLTAGNPFRDSNGWLFDARDGYQSAWVGSGLLAGAVYMPSTSSSFTLTLNAVKVTGSVASNVPFSGGLIGWCHGRPVSGGGTWRISRLNATNCSVSGATVNGSSNIGGFIGFACAENINVTKFTGSHITVNTNPQLFVRVKNELFCGIGGVFGNAYSSQLNISDDITLTDITVENSISVSSGNHHVGFGGLVGHASTFGTNSLSGITLKDVNVLDSSNAYSSVGSLIGFLSDTNHNSFYNDGAVSTFAISDVSINSGTSAASTLTGWQIGGLIGALTDGRVNLTIGGQANGTTTPSVSIRKVTLSKNSCGAYNFGGVIGSAYNKPTITIQNLDMNGVTVSETDAKSYASMILGRSASGNSTITLKDTVIANCTLKRSDDSQTGFLLGSSCGTKVTYNGFNILLKDCTTNASAFFAGTVDGNGSCMRVVAASAVNCTGGNKDFNTTTDSYVIRSDYTGAQTYQASSERPWVDVNPLSDLNGKVSGISLVTGDGAAFMANTTTPIGSQIAADGKYYNVSDAMTFFKGTNASGISLSDFSTAGGNDTAGMPNFPVLVLPAVSKAEVNTAVYNYISLLTNYVSSATTLNGKLKGNITAKTYKWQDTQFVEAAETSMTVDASGRIYATPGKYDNTLNQFTLLTVTYQDPTDTGNSYKLYIPIVVQKLLNYHFYASSIPGTLYSRDTYLKANSTAVTTHGDQITVLLTYAYDNGKTGDDAIKEWQGTVDNGEKLLWNFDKKIKLAQSGNQGLPSGTKLTLIDRNNQDKVYYAIYDGSGDILLKDFTDAAGQPYVKNALCDTMGLKATPAENGDNLFVVTEDSSLATVRIWENGKYVFYRPAAENEDGAKFSITVTQDTLLEEYYLTIQTPAGSGEFSNITVECERGLTNVDSNGMMPNKFVEENPSHPFSRNASENRILFGDFFKQNVTVTTDTAEEISDANNTINATLTATIDYKDETWRSRFADYANAIRLYQRFELQARDWTNGNAASTSFTDRTATIRYLNGETQVGSTETKGLGTEGIMVLDFPSNATGGVTVASTAGSLNAATLVAKVSLTYTTAQIQAQFHTRSDTTDGLQLWANSHLAYSTAALERSNNPASNSAEQHFYRSEIIPVTLVYNANGTDVDARVNQLGINGRVESAAAIDSVATYNVSVLDTAKYADTIHYSIELYRKDDSGNFVKVDAGNLLTVGALKATLTDRNGTEKTVNFGETFTGGIDITIPIRISLPLTVATGEGFAGTYANYKVELKVWLQNGGTQISGSEAQDYIIYTNAKIKFPLVTSN